MKNASTILLLTMLASLFFPSRIVATQKAQLRQIEDAKSISTVSFLKENKVEPVIEDVTLDENSKLRRFLPQEMLKKITTIEQATAEEVPCVLTLQLDIPDGYLFKNLRIFNSEKIFQVDFPRDDMGKMMTKATIEMPEGTFDFVASFYNKEKLPVFIIYELQDVANINELMFDASQATNCFKVIPNTPNGEVTLDIGELDENWNFNLIEKGNTQEYNCWLILTCNAENNVYSNELRFLGNAMTSEFNPPRTRVFGQTILVRDIFCPSLGLRLQMTIFT